MRNTRLVRWLMAPSRIPDAPPMWAVILVFGVGWDTVAGHWWVVCVSAVLALAVFAVRRLRLFLTDRSQ